MTENLKKFDVVLVDFGKDVLAGEQGGIRPAVLVQNDKGNHFSISTIVMPFTSKIKRTLLPTHIIISKDIHKGLTEDSIVLGECVRQISEKRIIKYLGRLDNLEDQYKVYKVLYANFD